MNQIGKPISEADLECAINRLRKVPIAELPQNLSSETAAALPHSINRWSTLRFASVARSTLARAASLVAVAVLLIAAVVAFLVPGPVQVAFAQVVEKARQADTVAFTLQQGTEKEHKVAASGSLFRVEHASGLVVIGDGTTKKQLIIDPGSKSGVVIDMSEHASVELATGLVEQLRNTRPTDAKPAGQETRDGKLADLFRVRGIKLFGIDTTGSGQGEMWVWVDRESMLPWRIELRMGASTMVTLKSMTWNVDLDPSSLVVQLPEGYSEVAPDALLKKMRPDRGTTERMTPAEAFRKWSGQKE